MECLSLDSIEYSKKGGPVGFEPPNAHGFNLPLYSWSYEPALTAMGLGGRIRTSEHPAPNRGVNQTHLRPEKSKSLRLDPVGSRRLPPLDRRRLVFLWYPGRELNP